jgi:hypothetical protein
MRVKYYWEIAACRLRWFLGAQNGAKDEFVTNNVTMFQP